MNKVLLVATFIMGFGQNAISSTRCEKQIEVVEDAVSLYGAYEISRQTNDLIYFKSEQSKQYALEDALNAANEARDSRQKHLCDSGMGQAVVLIRVSVFCNAMFRNLMLDQIEFASQQMQDRYVQALLNLAQFSKDKTVGCSQFLTPKLLSKNRVRK